MTQEITMEQLEKNKEAAKKAQEIRIRKQQEQKEKDEYYERKDRMYQLALENGIEDRGYKTISEWVSSYSGKTQISFEGKTYEAEGFGPKGTASHVSKDGYIRFTEIN